MKTILFLIVGFFISQNALGQTYYPTFVTDTTRFARDSNTTAYASGDIIASYLSTTKYFTFSNITSTKTNSRGKITYVTVQMDTANATNTTVKVRFFGLADTTGLWASLPADNAAYQAKFSISGGSVIQFGDVAVTLGIFGTAAGGSTVSEGSATAAIPYQLLNGKLYCVVLATGAFTPKAGGLFRVIVNADRQF